MPPAEPASLEDYLQLGAGALAAVIFVVSAFAYRRRPTTRTLLIAAGFGLLLLRSVLHSLADFVVAQATGDALESLAVPLEVAFLLLVAVAFLKP